MDGDSDLDVLSASEWDDTIAWYENDGTGNFGGRQIITSTADGACRVFAADMDGDGDQDVLSAWYSSSNKDDPSPTYSSRGAWFENDGRGTFGAPRVVTSALDVATSAFAADRDLEQTPTAPTPEAIGDP